jgi:hypothetical protein
LERKHITNKMSLVDSSVVNHLHKTVQTARLKGRAPMARRKK